MAKKFNFEETKKALAEAKRKAARDRKRFKEDQDRAKKEIDAYNARLKKLTDDAIKSNKPDRGSSKIIRDIAKKYERKARTDEAVLRSENASRVLKKAYKKKYRD